MHYRLTFNFLFSNILYYITTIRQNIKKPDINHEILDKTIILINNQSNLGEISTEEALNIAKNKGLDLVVVGEKSGVRVCKILDFSKEAYKKKKNTKKIKKVHKAKTIKLRPVTEIGDIKVKANSCQKILNKGTDVVVSVVFKGRERAYIDIGVKTLNRFKEELSKLGDFDFTDKSSTSEVGTTITKK